LGYCLIDCQRISTLLLRRRWVESKVMHLAFRASDRITVDYKDCHRVFERCKKRCYYVDVLKPRVISCSGLGHQQK
jgi:hypothetical protein